MSRLLNSITLTILIAGLAAAQAPAGPRRPAAVPADFVITPFGYFHPSCVSHLAKGDILTKPSSSTRMELQKTSRSAPILTSNPTEQR